MIAGQYSIAIVWLINGRRTCAARPSVMCETSTVIAHARLDAGSRLLALTSRPDGKEGPSRKVLRSRRARLHLEIRIPRRDGNGAPIPCRHTQDQVAPEVKQSEQSDSSRASRGHKRLRPTCSMRL